MTRLSRFVHQTIPSEIRSRRRMAALTRLIVLLAACLVCANGASQDQITLSFPEPHNTVVLSVPDRATALQLDLLRLRIENNSLRQDLTGRQLQAGDSQGFVLSSFLFPRGQTSDSKGLRDEEWAALRKGALRNGYKTEQVREFEIGSVPMLEYMIEEFQGKRVHQKNVFGFIVSGDMAMDFHISKVSYTPEDQKFFDSLVQGIKVIENYEPDAKLEFGYGSIFYLEKNWPRAIGHYEKALEQEKAHHTLSPTDWKVLVDNLGMAYGLSGDLQKAKSTFEYGVHEDATYPIFHYNLACTYAESNDLDKALEELKLAFQYRNNSIPGEEGMPDPAKDDSFKRYLGDSRFQSLAQELCPTSKRSSGGWVCK